MKTITQKQHSQIIKAMFYVSNPEMAQQIFMFVLFNEIPSTIQLDISESKQQKYLSLLKDKFGLKIIFKKEILSNRKREHDVEVLVDMKNCIIVEGSQHDYMYLYYCLLKTPKAIIEEYIKLARGHFAIERKKPRRNRIFILTVVGKGRHEKMGFSPFKLDKFEMDVNINYNEDFQPKYAEIKKRLSKKDDNGIVILYGEPGTGKTYFLRHLCQITKKKILYVPPALVQYIVEPFFIKMLGKHRNSILLIEDADNIMRKRDMNTNIQEVSSLLNISDGILQDILKLQIVVTFNTDLSKIDEAFLRKGRIIAEHKFDKLSAHKSQILSNSLGYNSTIKEPMTLADIYNQEVPDMVEKKPKNRIGYKQNGVEKHEIATK